MQPAFFRSVLAALCLAAGPASAESQFLSLNPSYIPNFFGLGVGSYPEYVGSDNDLVGLAPFGRVSWGDQRYATLEVNYVAVNLLNHRNWRAGPTGLLRFGRDDVEDPVVALLPEIDMSWELGAFAGYEAVGEDPRDRWFASAGIVKGVVGDNEGFVTSVSLRRWIPVGQFAALGLSLAASHGSGAYMDTYFSIDAAGAASSGLAAFDAGAGVRDVRLTAVLMQPLSREWQVGGGFLYSRLLNDAADSPIVRDRGSADQFVFGVGISRAF